MPDDSTPPILPPHIDETIRAIAQLHAEHHEKATPQQRAIDGLTSFLGRPWVICAMTVLVVGWIGFNLLSPLFGYPALDPPPFAWLEATVSVLALYMVVLILATQRHEEQLAKHRDLLTLELAILTEQKTAKVIELLEEVRRDNPLIRDRIDHEAETMAKPADPQSVLDAIKETHAKVDPAGGTTS